VLVPHSSLVDLLAQRPEQELVELRETAIAVRERAVVEIAVYDEALAKQNRKRGSKVRNTMELGTTRERVLRAIKKLGQASPADIVAASADEGRALPKGSVYNMLATLVEKGTIERVSDGVYALATKQLSGPSANGSSTAAAQVSPQVQQTPGGVGT
jgi:hypothetical protein